MLLKIIILSIALTQVVAAPEKSAIRDKVINLYEKDLKNVEKALHFVNQLSNVDDKVSGFHSLIELMKEDKHEYTDEMLKVIFGLKAFMEKAKAGRDNNLIQKTEDIKEILPSNLQNLTCTYVRLYQTGVGGYLYAYLTELYDYYRRYTFTNGFIDGSSTTWIIEPNAYVVYFRNTKTYEYLMTDDLSLNIGFTHTTGDKVSGSDWAIELVYETSYIRIRHVNYNKYLHVSEDTAFGNRITKVAADPMDSYWQIHCA